jgi:hypothetical protein
MRPIAFVKVAADHMPRGVLFQGNWLKLKGPGDIAYCPLPNFGDGWVLTRIPAAPAGAPAAAASRA